MQCSNKKFGQYFDRGQRLECTAYESECHSLAVLAVDSCKKCFMYCTDEVL